MKNDDKINLEQAAKAIEDFLEALGHRSSENTEIQGTGKRVAEAFYHELLSGYQKKPSEILQKTMPSQSKGTVSILGIETTIICPHHLLPASGIVHLAYRPRGKIAGLGSLAELVYALSRRLILQEELSRSLADALVEHLGARSSGVMTQFQPSCLRARGAESKNAVVTSWAFSGENSDSFHREFIFEVENQAKSKSI